MQFIKIFLVLIIMKSVIHVNVNAKELISATFDASNEKSSKFDTQKKTPGFRIRLPFMDMEVQNQRNLCVMQERTQKDYIFLLHGNELFQMFVEREEKRLSLVGYFGGTLKDMEPLNGEVILWHDYIILVIALDEHLEIYQLSNSFLEMRAKITKDPKRSNETAPTFEPIQQISLPGRYRQHFLTDPDKEHIMLIVGINFTKIYGRLHTFLWSNTYFEPIEELTIPPIHMLHMMGTSQKYLVRGRIIQHQTKTIITIYKIQSPVMTLHTTQTFTANSRIIHASLFRNKNYLIACSNQQKQCNSFRMNSDGLFNAYKQGSSQDLAFDKFVGGKNFLVAARQNQVFVFTNGRLDCYASFTTNETDITSIQTLVNAHGENFILLNYKRPFNTLIRFVELESETGDLLGAMGPNVTEVDDKSTLYRHRHMFEEAIGSLRSLLLRRRNAINSFRRISAKQNTKPLELEISHPVRIQAGNINAIKVIGQNLLSPLQLLQRISGLRQKFGVRRGKRQTLKDSKAESVVPTRLKVQHLKVRNLVYNESILAGFHLDKKAQPLPILSVRPKLITKSLSTRKLLARQHLRHPRANNDTSVTKFKIINVDTINNVSWQEFYDSLFLKNRDSKINGSLILEGPTKIEKLTTITLNEQLVTNFFNFELPQVIYSNLYFYGFLIRYMIAKTINGLDFANDVVFQNANDLIETPVIMRHLTISNDLILDGDATVLRKADGEEIELQQYYNGKVIINGSLTVKNLETEKAGRVMMHGAPFSRSYLSEKYLLQNEAQTFNSTVIFGNAKVTVPSLKTKFLNNNPTEEHLLSDEPSQVRKPLLLVFLNVHIEGDLGSKTMKTRIANLSRNAVLRGDVANITGIKKFAAPLTIDHVMTLSLNELPVTDMVLKSQLRRGFKFEGMKSFEMVWVGSEMHAHKELNATNLNKLPVEELLTFGVHVERLKVPFKLAAENIVFHKINDISFDEVFNNFKLRNGELVLHKELIIDGNVNFGEDLLVGNINGIEWNAYQADLVRTNDNAIITGKKCFLEELTITKSLKSIMLNELQMEKIFAKVLSKSKPQIIEGDYTFNNLKLSNIDVAIINDISTTEFIDLRTPNLIIEGDLIVPKVTVFGDIITSENNELLYLKRYVEQIKELPNLFWRNIVVTENAFWRQTGNIGKMQHELLSYLHRNAVQRYGQQFITGNVKLSSPVIANMKTKTAFPEDIDFDFLLKDCIFKNANKTQVITAEKTFSVAVHLQNVETEYLKTQLLNDINVQELNSALYNLSRNDFINGPIHFKTTPKIGQLFVEGLVNGINPLEIYHNATQKVPPIKICQLNVIDTLQINEINGNNLNYLLEKRITKQSNKSLVITGTLNFENLVLNEKVMLQNINGISMDKLVFKESKELQAVTGAKIIQGDLIFTGPVHVLRLNDEDLIESYQNSIFINRNYHYDTLRIDGATFEKGLIFTKVDNPLLAATIEDTTNRALIQKYKVIDNELNEIDRVLSRKSSMKSLLYLDYVSNWRVLWHAANVSSVHKSYTFELKKSTLCDRQYLNVQISKPNWKTTTDGTIYLSNVTTNFLKTSAYNISIKAENYCHGKYNKVKSKITITGANVTRVIGMKKYIEHLIIYSPNNGSVFILLHAIDLSRNLHEVRILRVMSSQQNNITDWQSLTIGIGKTLSLFEYTNYTALISGGGMLNNHPALAIYHFDTKIQKFVFVQTIDGDFDIHELLPIEPNKDFQLIFSCHRCQRVHIYSYKPNVVNSSYEILQILKLKTLIDKVKPFKVNDGSLYLLFLTENGEHYYYLYRFSPLQGWMHTTYGYFENTELALPLMGDELELNDSNFLALLCSVNSCSILRAIVV